MKVPDITELDTRIVNPQAVKMLEEMLEDAKSGVIFSIGCVYLLHDGSSGSAFTARWRPATLLGELRVLEHEVLQMNIDTRLHKAGKEF